MRSPLSLAFIYILLGVVFTFFAIRQVTIGGWGFFAFLLIGLATLDFGSGIRILLGYFKQKNKEQ